MDISVPTILVAVLPVLATMILFVLLASVAAFVAVPQPKGLRHRD